MANRNRLKNPDRYREKERARQRKARSGQRQLLADEKAKRGCLRCNETHPACLQFHHRDPKTKSFAVNRGVVLKMSLAEIEEEIAKCDLLCANCHAKLHWEQRNL